MGGERASKTRQRERGQICCICGDLIGGTAWQNFGERRCLKCEKRPHRVLLCFTSDGSGLMAFHFNSDAQKPITRWRRHIPTDELREWSCGRSQVRSC